MTLIRWFFVLLLCGIVGVFAASNSTVLSLGLWPLTSTLEIYLPVLVIAIFALGVILGRLSVIGKQWHWKAKYKNTLLRVQFLEQENIKLREESIPAPKASGSVAMKEKAPASLSLSSTV